jgi:hypothetical protein
MSGAAGNLLDPHSAQSVYVRRFILVRRVAQTKLAIFTSTPGKDSETGLESGAPTTGSFAETATGSNGLTRPFVIVRTLSRQTDGNTIL